MNPVEVDVKPAIASKINWTQIASVVAMGLAWFGLDIPAERLAEVFAAIQVIAAFVTIVFRTYFTATVTPAVAKKL
ncbi:MAG: hypothetical protein N2444_00280 [Methylocystis sp.]|nr:hypothetical protein [Methylocystis sp.]